MPPQQQQQQHPFFALHSAAAAAVGGVPLFRKASFPPQSLPLPPSATVLPPLLPPLPAASLEERLIANGLFHLYGRRMPLHSSLVKEWARESLALEEGAVGVSGALRDGGVDEEVRSGGVSSAMVHQQKLPRADKVMAAIAERLLELLGGLAARETKAATETKAEVGSDGSNTANSDIGQRGAHAAVPPYVGRLVAITVTFRPAVTQGIATVTSSAFSGVTAAATKGVEGLAVFEETAHAVAVAAPNVHGGLQQQQQQRFFSCLWFDDDPQYAPLNVVGNHDTSASVVAAAADFVVPMAGGASTAPNLHSANAHALSLSLSPSSSSSNVPIDLVTQQQQQQRPQRPRGLAGHTSIPASSSLPLASPPHLLPLPLPYPSDVLLAVFNQSLRDSMAARRRRLFGTETPLHLLTGSAAVATAPAIAAAAIGAPAGGGGSGWSWGDSFPSALSSSSAALARGDGDEVEKEDDALGDLLGSASASMPNVPSSSRDGSAVPSGGTKRPLPQGTPMRGGRQRSGGGGRGRGGASAGSADSDGRYIGYWRALCSKEVSAASIPTSPVPKPKGGEEGAVTTPPPSPAPPTLSFSAATSDSNALPMPSVAQVSPPPPPLNTSTSGGGRSAVGAGRGGLKFEEVEEEHTRISAQPPRLALGGSTTAAVANSGGGGSSSRRVAATTTAAGVGVAAKRPRDSPPPSSRGPPTTAAARAVRSVTTLDVDEDEDDDVLVIE